MVQLISRSMMLEKLDSSIDSVNQSSQANAAVHKSRFSITASRRLTRPGRTSACERSQQIITSRERSQAGRQQRQGDVHGDHGLPVDRRVALAKLHELAGGDADDGADEGAEHDLVEHDQSNLYGTKDISSLWA